MADAVALGIQTPNAMQSLGQVMNIANGAQQLQAGQIANQANASTLQEKQNIRGLFADGGKKYMDENGNLDFNKLGPDMLAAAPTTGAQTMQQMYGAQKDAVAARSSLLSLDTSARQATSTFVASLSGDTPEIAQQKMAGLASFQPSLAPALNYAWKYSLGPAAAAVAQAKASGDPQALANAQAAYQQQVGAVAKQAMTVGDQNAATAPVPGTLNKGTDIVPTVTTPSFLGSQPSIAVGTTPLATAQISPAQAQTTNADGTTTIREKSGVVTGTIRTAGLDTSRPPITAASMDISSPAQLPHTPRTAGQPYAADPSEPQDLAAGQQLRTGLIAHLNNTAELNNNLNESFKAITKLNPGAWYTSGAAGTALRTLKNFVGSSDYQQLSKDLANVQLSQLQAQGGSMQTDAAKNLQSMASGTSTYNPDVLLNIMQRTQAKQTELQMQAPGLQAFSQKFGDANSAKFTQEWAKNADSKVFQAIGIANSGIPAAEQQQQIDVLLGNDPKARKVFFTKYNNIKSLSGTGVLPSEAGSK